MGLREEYETLRGLGLSKRNAARQTMVNAVRDDEAEQLERGLTYDPA